MSTSNHRFFFHPKRGSFYHRATVPRRLRRLLGGRCQTWRSLKTGDKDEARAKAAQWEARIQRLFWALRKDGERMTPEQREELVARWLEARLENAEDYRVTLGPDFDEEGNFDTGRAAASAMFLAEGLEEVTVALQAGDYRLVEKDADDLLKAAGFPLLDHDSADFKRLCRRLLVAQQEYLRIEIDRWNGKYTADHRLPLHRLTITPPMVQTSANGPATKQPVKPEQPTSPLLSVVFEKYMAENPHAERTIKPLKAEFNKFLSAIGGDRPIAEVTKADGRTYKEHLLNVRKIGPLTVAKYIGMIGTMFRWAGRQDYVPEGYNPMNGLAPPKKLIKKQMGKRRPFADDELLKLFGSAEFVKEREKTPERFWIPLLCLFQVCRREEAGQLAIVDIMEENGIPYMRINDDEKLQQTLKNEGSR